MARTESNYNPHARATGGNAEGCSRSGKYFSSLYKQTRDMHDRPDASQRALWSPEDHVPEKLLFRGFVYVTFGGKSQTVMDDSEAVDAG